MVGGRNLVAGSRLRDTVAVVLDPVGGGGTYIAAPRERAETSVNGYPVVFGDSVLWVESDALAVMALKPPRGD